MKSLSSFFLRIARLLNPDLTVGFMQSVHQKERKRFWESEMVRSESIHTSRISSVEEGIIHLSVRIGLDYRRTNKLEDGFVQKEENGDLILRDKDSKPLFSISKSFLENHQKEFCDTFMFAHDGYWRRYYTEKALYAHYQEMDFKKAKELYEVALEFGSSFAKDKLQELERIKWEGD